MVWTLLVLVSLLVLMHQYENWRAARELAEVRRAVLARVGTENLMDILPAEVAADSNFYAIPVIQSWRRRDSGQDDLIKYEFPAEKLFPNGFQLPEMVDVEGWEQAGLDAWMRSQLPPAATATERADQVGKWLTRIKDPAAEAILIGLIAGLDRPESQMIPCRRRCLEEAGGDPAAARIPWATGVFALQRALAVYAYTAALAGDSARARDLALVMLKLGDGMVNDPGLVSQIAALTLNKVTLPLLNRLMESGVMVESDYLKIQNALTKTDDVRATELTMFETLLSSGTVFARFRERMDRASGIGPAFEWKVFLGSLVAPMGWVDANRAHAARMMLGLAGDGGGETWRTGDQGSKEVGRIAAAQSNSLNPRTILARIQVPALSGVWTSSAKNLFYRRCAILACALHRHRLLHGAFPNTLAELDAGLLPGPQMDPAKAEGQLQYRMEGTGFLLWSVGLDRVDDGGDAAKDWIWRQAIL